MYPQDEQRDAEVRLWNEALRTGDQEVIAVVRQYCSKAILRRIMDDDLKHEMAGWTP